MVEDEDGVEMVHLWFKSVERNDRSISCLIQRMCVVDPGLGRLRQFDLELELSRVNDRPPAEAKQTLLSRSGLLIVPQNNRISTYIGTQGSQGFQLAAELKWNHTEEK